MRKACLPSMLQTYALFCHWVFPRCNRSPCKTWKHPQRHQIYSDGRMTNHLDTGQQKSFQNGRTTRAIEEILIAKLGRETVRPMSIGKILVRMLAVQFPERR